MAQIRLEPGDTRRHDDQADDHLQRPRAAGIGISASKGRDRVIRITYLHDSRHAPATSATGGGPGLESLPDASGWKSPAMPLRYVKSTAVANTGVRLLDEEQ